MSNERAKSLFDELELVSEYEPDWIVEGKRPDFFCSGAAEFWCEVKTVGPTPEHEALGRAHEDLRLRAEGIELPGAGFLWVDASADQRDAKLLMQLIERAIARFAQDDAPDRLMAIVPRHPVSGQFVKFSISTKEHTAVEVHACVSATGNHEHPPDLLPEPYDQRSIMVHSSGEEEEVVARNVLTLNDDFRMATDIWPDDKPFRFIATGQTGLAKETKNVERIREALADANSQFKNALDYKDAPCIALIFQSGALVPDDETIKSALYGDLKYTFRPDKFEEGVLILEGNGVWSETKRSGLRALPFLSAITVNQF